MWIATANRRLPVILSLNRRLDLQSYLANPIAFGSQQRSIPVASPQPRATPFGKPSCNRQPRLPFSFGNPYCGSLLPFTENCQSQLRMLPQFQLSVRLTTAAPLETQSYFPNFFAHFPPCAVMMPLVYSSHRVETIYTTLETPILYPLGGSK